MAGEPLDPSSPRRKSFRPMVPLGTGGTAVYGGYIQQVEKDPSLFGRKRYQTFADIYTNLSIVAAGVRHFLNLVAKAGWKVEPNEDAGDAGKRAAELVESALYDMTTSWTRIVRGAALYRFHGFGVQEWTSKRRKDGAIGFADIERRPQITIERWDVDMTGTVLGVWQRSPQDQQERYLPRGKLFYMVDDSLTDSPEGLGLFRHLVEPARRLNRYHQIEGFGFETDLRGTPVVRAPLTHLDQLVETSQLTKEQRDQLIQPLEDFLKNHMVHPERGLMLDSQTYISQDDAGTPSAQRLWDAETMRSDGGQAHQFLGEAIERINRELARILNMEQLLLGEGDSGSHALSRDKTQALALVVDSVLTELSEQAEKDVVAPLLLMNGMDPAEVGPNMKTDSSQFRDVEQIAKVLSEMAAAGAPMAPDDPAINEVRDLIGLSNVDLENLRQDAEIRIQAEREQFDAMRNGGGDDGGDDPNGGDPVENQEEGAENTDGPPPRRRAAQGDS